MRRLLLAFILFCLAPLATAQEWLAIPEKSTIKFVASYDDSSFEGDFQRFSSRFLFDQNTPSHSRLSSTIDVTSVNTRSRDRDEALAGKEWFYFSKFPEATFTSQSIIMLDENLLQIKGLLTIRDQQNEITFPMQWASEGEHYRVAKARIPLDRRDYQIGTGEWLKDNTIGFDVEVFFSLTYQASDKNY